MPSRPSRLQREIRQTRPFRSLGHEATVGLLRTVDLLRRALGGILAADDLTLQQYNVLRILRGAGPEGLPTLAIAERMIEQAPGITRLVDRLMAKRLVRRERCPVDRRQVTVRITPQGLALLDRLEGPMADADHLLTRSLRAADLARLVRLLDRLREGLAPEPGPPA